MGELPWLLEQLATLRGDVVSVGIPSGGSCSEVVSRLSSELSEARNIRSRTTRKAVSQVLTRILSRLRALDSLPGNGLFVYGISTEDTVHILLLTPPEPLTSSFYRCGRIPETGLLAGMIEPKDVLGLIVVDRKEAAWGLLKGSSLVLLSERESHLMGKHDAGGQSQRRIERIMENEESAWYRLVSEAASSDLLDRKVTGVLVGGPGRGKDQMLAESPLDHRLRPLVISPTFATGYADEAGLREMVQRASGVLAQRGIGKELRAFQEFLEALRTGRPCGYGPEVGKALMEGRVAKLLLHRKPDLARKLAVEAGRNGTEVIWFGQDTESGKRLLAMGGVAAMMRY